MVGRKRMFVYPVLRIDPVCLSRADEFAEGLDCALLRYFGPDTYRLVGEQDDVNAWLHAYREEGWGPDGSRFKLPLEPQ